MKFILVNHRTPLDRSACIRCSRSLGPGYLRDVSTQRPYCDYDCYLRHEMVSLFVPRLAVTRTDQRPASTYPMPFDMIASFAVASCWCSLTVARVAVRVGELMATEAFDT